jgi:hypothetical protein
VLYYFDHILLLRFRSCLNASVLENSDRRNVWGRVANGLVILYWLIFSSPACVVIAALRIYVYFDIDLIEGDFRVKNVQGWRLEIWILFISELRSYHMQCCNLLACLVRSF